MPVRVHAGDCWDARKRCTALGMDEARRALAEVRPPARSAGPTSPSACSSDRRARRARSDGVILGRKPVSAVCPGCRPR
ncbi:DUF6233 domain-containing protein [Streptomyces sp. NBC_01296]|nr:DUF6233 domain-containing protein [Streptomyces sp. NBC_01296]